MSEQSTTNNEQRTNNNEQRTPGVCIPWEVKKNELPRISGDEQLARKVWEDIDELGYMYIWQCLLSF